MLPTVISCCAVSLHVTKIYCMLCNVVTRGTVFLNFMQQCSMLWCVLACCAVLLHVTKSYYMMCSVVRCYQELLHVVQCYYELSRVIHDMQCCEMLPTVITMCGVLTCYQGLHFVPCYYVLSRVITWYAVLLDVTNQLLHVVQCC